jgi:hypothetical protein
MAPATFVATAIGPPRPLAPMVKGGAFTSSRPDMHCRPRAGGESFSRHPSRGKFRSPPGLLLVLSSGPSISWMNPNTPQFLCVTTHERCWLGARSPTAADPTPSSTTATCAVRFVDDRPSAGVIQIRLTVCATSPCGGGLVTVARINLPYTRHPAFTRDAALVRRRRRLHRHPYRCAATQKCPCDRHKMH